MNWIELNTLWFWLEYSHGTLYVHLVSIRAEFVSKKFHVKIDPAQIDELRIIQYLDILGSFWKIDGLSRIYAHPVHRGLNLN